MKTFFPFLLGNGAYTIKGGWTYYPGRPIIPRIIGPPVLELNFNFLTFGMGKIFLLKIWGGIVLAFCQFACSL